MNHYARRAALNTMGADRNAPALKRYAEALGLSVEVLPGGNGRPDWDVGGWGVDAKAEIKPALAPGDVPPSASRLNKRQVEWHRTWRGAKPFILRTHEDVLAMAKTIREWSEVLRGAQFERKAGRR